MDRSTIEAARGALGKRAWSEAFDAFDAADVEEPLEPEDLEGMAKAGWWTGRPNRSIEARERAYAAYVERGDKASAAFAALTLRREYNAKLQGSVAQGWLTRAETLLDGEPESKAFTGHCPTANEPDAAEGRLQSFFHEPRQVS